MKKKRLSVSRVTALLLICYFVCTVILPLGRMMLFMNKASINEVFSSPQLKSAALNSVLVTAVSTVLSVFLAFMLAWGITRTTIKFKKIFTAILTIPMLVPSISHSTGLIMLFGKNGFVTNILNLETSIYGFGGIVLGSVIYSFPFAFIMLSDILIYENASVYDAADIFGISKWKQMRDITLPFLRKPLILVFFSTFAIIFTDYGIPVAVGGDCKTLPVIMYQEVIGRLDFAKGSVIGSLLLIPALISFIIDLAVKDKGNLSYITQKYIAKKGMIRDILIYALNSIVCIFIVCINAAFIVLAFTEKYPVDMRFSLENFQKAFEMNGILYLGNSLIVSILVAGIGTMLGFVTAYLTSRNKSAVSRGLHLAAITSLAIPGMVLGLSYVLMFKKSFIYGTIIILIMVNITHFMASPYLMMYNALGKMNANLESVGETLGISRFKMVKDVFIPQVKSTLLEMGIYLFINSMVTISAVSFLATTNNKPFSLMINQFDALMIIECSAVVSLILLIVNLVCKGMIYFLNKYYLVKDRKIDG